MTATYYQLFFHKWKNPSEELWRFFKDKKQTQKQCGSLVSTTEGDKDVYKHIAILRFSDSRWRNKAFFKGSTATVCFIPEGCVSGKNIKYRINIALTVSLDVDVSGLLWFQPERCGDQVEQTIIIRENNFFFTICCHTVLHVGSLRSGICVTWLHLWPCSTGELFLSFVKSE